MNNPQQLQPSYIYDDDNCTIRVPWPSDVSNQNRLSNHLDNIKWLAHDFGGVLNAEKTEWLFAFDREEYNCVRRYLSNAKFDLKGAHYNNQN